jgi:hypothetical protein
MADCSSQRRFREACGRSAIGTEVVVVPARHYGPTIVADCATQTASEDPQELPPLVVASGCDSVDQGQRSRSAARSTPFAVAGAAGAVDAKGSDRVAFRAVTKASGPARPPVDVNTSVGRPAAVATWQQGTRRQPHADLQDAASPRARVSLCGDLA